jgi:hypothetical protein
MTVIFPRDGAWQTAVCKDKPSPKEFFVHLAVIYRLVFANFMSHHSNEGKKFKTYIRKDAVELWRVTVPHSTITRQLKIL